MMIIELPKNVVAKNPGSWANGIRVGIIDAKADQILGSYSQELAICCWIWVLLNQFRATLPGAGTTSVLDWTP